MGRSNQTRHLSDPERILPRTISKYETLIIKCTQEANRMYTLEPPDKPLGDDNDLLILNNVEESTLSFAVNGSLVEPGTGVQFRWAGGWYLIGDPVLEGLITELRENPPSAQNTRIDDVATSSVLETQSEVAYLADKVSANTDKSNTMIQQMNRLAENADGSDSMWGYLKGEVETLDGSVAESTHVVNSMQKQIEQLEESTNGADSMWADLKEEVAYLERKLAKSDACIAALETHLPKMIEDIAALQAVTENSNVLDDIKLDITALQASKISNDCALSGDVVWGDPHEGDIKVSAAALNAAAAGTFKCTVMCRLETDTLPLSSYHDWAQFSPILPIPSKGDVADADVAAPAIEGSPTLVPLVNGVVSWVLVLDTDAGATKTYVSGEQMSLGSIKVAADDLLPTKQLVAAHSVTISVID